MGDINFVLLLSQVVKLATPLLLAALGETMAESSGVIILALDGLIMLSALAAFVVAFSSGNLILGVVVGPLVGILLAAIFGYNFRQSLAEHANPQRPGYALGDEPGLLLCSWPKGGKPTLPFVYSDEVWTGIEYQVAGHLIAEGLVEEGLTVVRAVRSRYDGRARNPWNEYECGNFYARALASYGLLQALSGFRYSAPEQHLHFAPTLAGPFECFFSTASAWGTIAWDGAALSIDIAEGSLEIKQVSLELQDQTNTYPVDARCEAGRTVLWQTAG